MPPASKKIAPTEAQIITALNSHTMPIALDRVAITIARDLGRTWADERTARVEVWKVIDRTATTAALDASPKIALRLGRELTKHYGDRSGIMSKGRYYATTAFINRLEGTEDQELADAPGTVRRSPGGGILAVLWPSPPHPHRWMVTDKWGSLGYEADTVVASWSVVGAVPYSPAAGMELAETRPAITFLVGAEFADAARVAEILDLSPTIADKIIKGEGFRNAVRAVAHVRGEPLYLIEDVQRFRRTRRDYRIN